VGFPGPARGLRPETWRIGRGSDRPHDLSDADMEARFPIATPHGRLMLTVLGGLAEFECEPAREADEGKRGVILGGKPKLTQSIKGKRRLRVVMQRRC
jgi:hypothetical protein